MKVFSLIVVVLAGLVASSTGARAANDRTITKVVKALQKMLDLSKGDSKSERELYGKFKCYCDNSEAEKTQSIEDLDKQIGLLENEIGELQGSTGELSMEVAKLKADMAANEQARSEAESLRTKQHEDFVAAETDMTEAIDQMGKAIDALSAIGADQTLAAAADHEKFMAGNSKKAMLVKLQVRMKEALVAASAFLPPAEKRSVESFMQAPFTGSYSAQSGGIVGILKQMKETFGSNLDSARAAEKAQIESYDKFMKLKKDEFGIFKGSYEDKQGTLGANDETLAAKKETLQGCVDDKAAAEDFLGKLKVMCSEKAKDYEQRSLLRAQEEAALAEAISILDSDQAFSTFGKTDATSTGATGFLQMSSRHRRVRVLRSADVRVKALQVLQRVKGGSVRLAKIEAMLQAENPFTVVLDEIDKMIVLIVKEGKADKEQLDWCNDERTTNDGDLEKATTEIETLKGEIQDLDNDINSPDTGYKVRITETEASLVQNHDAQVAETETRKEENVAYQKDAAHLADASDILARAVKVLRKYYDALAKKNEADSESAALVQDDPTPPSTWEGDFAGQSSKGGDAIDMIEFILEETKKEEMAAHKEEEDSQASYEDSMTAKKEEEATLQESLVNLKKELADAEKEHMAKSEDLKKTEAEKKAIEEYLEKIKPGCDFITKNFDEREANRATETGALEEAITLLKDTPAYKAAVTAAEHEDMGKCKETCVGNEDKDPVVAPGSEAECKACRADVTVPAYCAGHKGTAGC